MPVTGMDVVMIDNIASVAYLEHDDDVQRMRTVFDVLRATALGPGPSLDLIKQAAHLP
ncbi:Scr1 family TA system antitoxin-like transcriptional regulator [Streptomyces sp. RB6PN25]|uniref:Scr1 family TA system antitoxin-like transcriptional regulator n=1 Tax=Streptomyces humicola TaxID=2953240 RepID=A0ABT1PW52_9ACTN|nr:Scr1 family TA system antitoxin-like transcriptional regulator [Streptomyces humicola]